MYHPHSVRHLSNGLVFLSLLAILSVLLAACGGTAKKGPTRDYLTLVENQTDAWTQNFNPFFDAT